MRYWPNLPRSYTSVEQVVLDFFANCGEGISIDNPEVQEENTHEHGAPCELVDSNLRADVDGISAGDYFVEIVVEVVSGGAVEDESEGTECGKTHIVNGPS